MEDGPAYPLVSVMSFPFILSTPAVPPPLYSGNEGDESIDGWFGNR